MSDAQTYLMQEKNVGSHVFFHLGRCCAEGLSNSRLYTPESRPQFLACALSLAISAEPIRSDISRNKFRWICDRLYLSLQDVSAGVTNAWHSSKETALETGTNYLGI